MGLSDELADPPPRAVSAQCLTCRVLETLDPQEAEDLQDAIHGHRWTDVALAELLQSKDYNVTESSLGNHRQKNHR